MCAPNDDCADGQPGQLGQKLAGGQRLPTDAADAAFALFDYNQNAAHSTLASNFSFSTSAAAASFGVPGSICVVFCFCGSAIRSSTTTGAASTAKLGRRYRAHLLGLGALDAHQRGVAQLVAAGLDGEHRRGGQVDGLEPALFQLALHRQAGVSLFHLQDERGVGQAEQFGQDDAGLALAQVFGLEAGEHQVGISPA